MVIIKSLVGCSKWQVGDVLLRLVVLHGLVVELAPGCEFRDAVALKVGSQLADLVELGLKTHAVALVVVLKLLMDHGDLLVDFGV